MRFGGENKMLKGILKKTCPDVHGVGLECEIDMGTRKYVWVAL